MHLFHRPKKDPRRFITISHYRKHTMVKLSKACSSFHSRKIRCDLGQVVLPCSQCREDNFQCEPHIRKARRTKARNERNHNDSLIPVARSSLPSSIPEHHMLHKFPMYSLFRHYPQEGRARLASNDRNHGVLMPLPMEDPSYTSPNNSIRTSSLGRGSPRSIPEPDRIFLEQKGAFSLPPRHITDELIQSYFKLFHPFFPVIDKEVLISQYRKSNDNAILSGRGPSLLLLHSILFTAVPVG